MTSFENERNVEPLIDPNDTGDGVGSDVPRDMMNAHITAAKRERVAREEAGDPTLKLDPNDYGDRPNQPVA